VMDARDARQSFTKRATRDGDAGGAQESSTRLSDAGRGDGALGSGRRSGNRQARKGGDGHGRRHGCMHVCISDMQESLLLTAVCM
jgi:hypothetical protein